MRGLMLRSAVLASAALAAVAVTGTPSYAVQPLAAPAATGQPYCPGPPLGTFWGTTTDANGGHTDTYISINFPSPGLNIRTRSC
jgi:hypothetical protein